MKTFQVCFTVIIFVLLSLPLFADLTVDSVTFTVDHLGGGIVQVGYSSSGSLVPTAIGLKVTLIDGSINSLDDVVTGTSAFNVFPDYYYSNGVSDSLPGTGAHPLANPFASGELNISSPTSVFSVSMAAFGSHVPISSGVDLNWDGIVDMRDLAILTGNWLMKNMHFSEMGDINADGLVDLMDMALLNECELMPPANVTNLFTVHVDNYVPGQTALLLELDAFRGGIIVDQLGNPMTAVLPNALVLVPEPLTAMLLALGGLAIRRRISHPHSTITHQANQGRFKEAT